MSTPTPQTDARLHDPVEYFDQGGSTLGRMLKDEYGEWVLADFARRLERRAAAWAKSARGWRKFGRVQIAYTRELADKNAESNRRIVALICERDRLQYRAQERRALRTEIEQALGMESLPGDFEDSSLKRGLAIIAGWKQEIAALTADLARVTAAREALQSRDGQALAWKAVFEALRVLPEFQESDLGMGVPDCGCNHALRTIARLAAMRARNAELVADLDERAAENSELHTVRAELCQCQLELASVRSGYHALRAALAVEKETSGRFMVRAGDAELQLAALRARVAELEAALRNYKRLKGCHGEYRAWSDLSDALARAESAAPDHIPDANKMVQPAPHPDTVRLDWLAAVDTYQRLHAVRVMLPITGYPTATATDPVRAAIDAAMKEGGK